MSETTDTNRGPLVLEELEDFFESAPVSLHWVGRDGTILRANRFELDFLGYGRDEYEGRHISEFHADQDVIEDILDRLARGETIDNQPARLIAKDGAIKHVLISSNVRWVNGDFAHTRCFTRDVTERVLLEQELEDTVAARTQELEEANRRLQGLLQLKDRFVAMASHELRTPLTSIQGFSATMERRWEALADEQKREFVHIIGRQSERLTRLVGDLLTLAQISSGKLELRAEPLPLLPIAERAAADLALTDLSIDVPPGLRACADPDALEQILVNFLANALKYGEPPISIAAAPAGEYVELRVADEGRGVAPGFRPFLFDEYARDPEEPRAGSGLGLAIVRQLAEANGGEAWHEPNSPRGAVFAVRLPAAPQ